MRVTALARAVGVERRMLTITLGASIGATIGAVYQSWPGWAIVAAALLPWVPLMGLETHRLRLEYGWFALFYVLTITQTGHMIEHVAQMVQMHVLHSANQDGVIGVLNIEWVHFGWNTWVFLAAVALVYHYRHNPWLWATFALAAWHEVEHGYLLSLYLRHGFSGLPGLLDSGGAIGGGLPIKGPNLHFLYNLVETVPLVAAFVHELRLLPDNADIGMSGSRIG